MLEGLKSIGVLKKVRNKKQQQQQQQQTQKNITVTSSLLAF